MTLGRFIVISTQIITMSLQQINTSFLDMFSKQQNFPSDKTLF